MLLVPETLPYPSLERLVQLCTSTPEHLPDVFSFALASCRTAVESVPAQHKGRRLIILLMASVL